MQETKTKKIVIDEDACIGCGACEGSAPDYFELGTDGKAKVIKQYNEEDADLLEEVKDNCPAGAIQIVDSE